MPSNGVMWRWKRRFDSTADQTRQNMVLTLTHTHLTNWLSGRWPKEISWGTFKTVLHVCLCVDLLTPLSVEVGIEGGWKQSKGLWKKRDLKSYVWKERKTEQRGVVWRSWIAEKGAVVEGRGGAVCLFQCLAQLGLVRLQASPGEPSLLPRRCQLPVVV